MITSKNMITAAQARITAQANYDKKIQAEIDDINTDILSAVNEGKMGITRHSYVNPETQKYLEDLGYTVSVQFDGRNEDYTEICW